MPRTTIIILHYRGVIDTIGCLQSVLPQRSAALDVLLVDNGSTDGLAKALAESDIEVETLRLCENQGWAGGNNAGIRWAHDRGADMVCLLNNDTLVPAGTFATLSEVSHRLGPCLLHPAIDYADPAEGVQLDPSIRSDAVTFPAHLPDDAKVFRLDFAYGACLLIPMAVFDRIGTFDERFFLQLEEADFFDRARNAGIPSLCLPSVRIVHAESRSFGGRDTPDKTYYITRNRLLLAEKSRPRWRAYRAALRLILWRADERANGSVLRWFLSGQPQAKAMRQGFRDYCLRRFGRRAGPF